MKANDTSEMKTLNALTFDIEEWYQTVLFNNGNKINKISNLHNNIIEILDILDAYKIKATFFILGAVAKDSPDLVKMIYAKGHEIASHGYFHRVVYKLSEKEFRDDVMRSLDTLGNITNSVIIGYRAPTWSILKSTHWAVDILEDCGLKYDSSIYPVSKNPFKNKKIQLSPYKIRTNLIEFPPPVFEFLGYNFPFAGGIFLRMFTKEFINNKIRQFNNNRLPALVYFHSWEFDRDINIIKMPGWKRLIQYGNLGSVRAKLNFLLQGFKFCSMKEILQSSGLIKQ